MVSMRRSMDFKAIGAVAEIVSAIGVIASLIYLAIQVRQNTRAVRNSTHHALTTTRLDYIALVAENPDLSRILRVGSEDYAALAEDERHRFDLIMYYSFSAGENFFYQYTQGALDQGQWERWCETLRQYFTQQGIREWFASTPRRFSASFSDFLENEFKKADQTQ